MEYLVSDYLSTSQDPGVYLLKDSVGGVLYVGKASNLRKRLSSYFQKSRVLDSKTSVLVSQVKTIETIPSTSEIEAFLLEARLIKKYSPKYNIRLTDGKNYLLLKVTIKDEFPKILFARREEDQKSKYFGPYPSSASLKTVLKTLRKIFPYIAVKNHANRVCLYNHLGLCPCPITLDTKEKKDEYKRNIRRIINFFNGKISDVLKDLEKERNEESKSENFEKALAVQKQIDAIILITSPFYKPFEFDENHQFLSEVSKREINELGKYLNENGVNVGKLKRIECFDISNTSGTNATGSMVVFTNGQRDSSSYRRFKIKNPPKVIPNDFKMMKEVIRRRLNHLDDWGIPSLIIVDGGKGQVSSASEVLDELGQDIPLVGLAKREELIVTRDFRIIRLPRNSYGLNLIRRIRDEAHRFAITYHRKLRSKATFA